MVGPFTVLSIVNNVIKLGNLAKARTFDRIDAWARESNVAESMRWKLRDIRIETEREAEEIEEEVNRVLSEVIGERDAEIDRLRTEVAELKGEGDHRKYLRTEIMALLKWIDGTERDLAELSRSKAAAFIGNIALRSAPKLDEIPAHSALAELVRKWDLWVVQAMMSMGGVRGSVFPPKLSEFKVDRVTMLADLKRRAQDKGLSIEFPPDVSGE